VINEAGEPIPNAKVSVLRGEAEIVSVQSGSDGRFSFERLDSGNYEVRVEAEGYKTARSPVTVAKPGTKCKGGLQVLLAVGMGCSSVGRVKR